MMMKGEGINKRSQRCRRNFLKALRNYLWSDSYMYGPLIYPSNYSAAPTRRPPAKGAFWQTKRTSVTLSSVKVHKSLKPSASYQSNETGDPICHGDHAATFRDVPVEKIEQVKHVIDHSGSPSTIDHINQSGTPETASKQVVENGKRSSQDKSGKDLSPLVL